MIEYMSLIEAWEKIKIGDSVHLERNQRGDPMTIEKQTEGACRMDFDGTLNIHDAISRKWQVIPAGPKVLTTDKIKECLFPCTSGRYDYRRLISDPDPYINKLIEITIKNSRLERDLEFEPLLKAVEGYLEVYPELSKTITYKNIKEAIRKLKPLNPDVDRSHEECGDCLLESIDPPRCKGHVAGPNPCSKFKEKREKE